MEHATQFCPECERYAIHAMIIMDGVVIPICEDHTKRRGLDRYIIPLPPTSGTLPVDVRI